MKMAFGISKINCEGNPTFPLAGKVIIYEGTETKTRRHSGDIFFSARRDERKWNPESRLFLKSKRDSGSSRLALGDTLVRNDTLRGKDEMETFCQARILKIDITGYTAIERKERGVNA